MPRCSIVKTAKQVEAVRLMASTRTVALWGGSRSGKTFIALYAMNIRALMYAGSRQLVARFRFAHAKQSICYDTMPKLLELMGLSGVVRLNHTDWFYEFPNGSTIWIGGLDDKERVDKILGNEYATIFLNEASQISFGSYETIVTRLNAPKGCAGRCIVDYNPPTTAHWSYKMFEKHELPDGRKLPPEQYRSLQMNPDDNRANISDDYIAQLENLSANKRERFLYGRYSTDSGALWRRAWISYREPPEKLDRVVVGVDPSGSVGGDEIGIVIAGRAGDEFYILDDYSLHGTPQEWAGEAIAAYHNYKADCIVAERNYGGDMVEATIRAASDRMGRPANVKLVTATRGKAIRAEPISALYEQGKVFHRTPFTALEDELCLFDPETSESPNRLDAMVWAVSHLYEKRGIIVPDYSKRSLGL